MQYENDMPFKSPKLPIYFSMPYLYTFVDFIVDIFKNIY